MPCGGEIELRLFDLYPKATPRNKRCALWSSANYFAILARFVLQFLQESFLFIVSTRFYHSPQRRISETRKETSHMSRSYHKHRDEQISQLSGLFPKPALPEITGEQKLTDATRINQINRAALHNTATDELRTEGQQIKHRPNFHE